MYDKIESACAGTVISEPSMRQVRDGSLPLLSFSIVVGGNAETGGGQFVKCAIFGEKAAELAPKIAKGARVYLEGELKLNTWEGHAGQQRAGLNLSAWRCELLGQIGRNRPKAKREPNTAGNTFVRPAPPDRDRWQAPLDDALPI